MCQLVGFKYGPFQQESTMSSIVSLVEVGSSMIGTAADSWFLWWTDGNHFTALPQVPAKITIHHKNNFLNWLIFHFGEMMDNKTIPILILTFNMLNCFKYYKRDIYSLNHILDLVWSK